MLIDILHHAAALYILVRGAYSIYHRLALASDSKAAMIPTIAVVAAEIGHHGVPIFLNTTALKQRDPDRRCVLGLGMTEAESWTDCDVPSIYAGIHDEHEGTVHARAEAKGVPGQLVWGVGGEVQVVVDAGLGRDVDRHCEVAMTAWWPLSVQNECRGRNCGGSESCEDCCGTVSVRCSRVGEQRVRKPVPANRRSIAIVLED